MQFGRTCRRGEWLLRVSFLTSIRRAYASRGRGPFAIYQRPPNPPGSLSIQERRKPWAEASNAELERILAWQARHASSRKLSTVQKLLSYMQTERQIHPTPAHYEALILANTAEDGSASNVRQLLSAMSLSGVQVGGLIDNAVLEVLAVHPDPILRQETLQKMAREWNELSPRAAHNNIAALLREGEVELAQKEIHRVESGGSDIPAWVHVLLVHSLVQRNDFEALADFIHALHDKKIDLPRKTWSYLLETSTQAGHFPVADWIWSKHVEPMYIAPTKQNCICMVRLAIQEHQLHLAERVLRVLETIDADTAKECDDIVKAAYELAGSWRPEPQPSRSIHAIFKNHPEAFFDAEEALNTPPLKRFLNPAHRQRKEKFEDDWSKK